MYIFAFICHLLGFASSIQAIMAVRTEQGAIAWAVSLNAFPYIAVPAYWIFGRSRFEGYVKARQEALAKVAGIDEVTREAILEFKHLPEDLTADWSVASRLVGLPVLKDNAVELLIDGEKTFDSLLSGIEEAREYVLFQFFIIHDDEIGRRVKERLIAKAQEGVTVFFLYDEIGCHDLPDSYLEDLRKAGVQAHNFHSRKGGGNKFQLNFRNHRKIVVVDGKTAWIGGHNVGDEYLGRSEKFGHWRDTHVRLEGPAVLAAQLSFSEDWHWATDNKLELNWKPEASKEGGLPVLVAPSGPADELETANLLFVHAINSAKERIWIASPYFVPDRSAITALQLAATRGVDVRILIPEKPDHIGVYLSAFSYLEEVGKTGVKLYRYQDGFLHQKVVLVDDETAAVGTANFDNRSFRLNFEVTAIIFDRGFAGQVEQMLEKDFSRSRLMDDDEYASKPWWFRLAVRTARLTAPIQ